MALKEMATEIVRQLQNAGFAAYWVGGCVRDWWLGKEPNDYDIATSALPEEIEALFPNTVAVGKQFGVILVLQDSHPFQVATFRSESDYTDGRRPDKVTFSSPEEDASRRDFTVNGLFYDPIAEQTSDWVGGLTDLRERRIRTIGDPECRFAEDHLRLLRAVRFAAQLDFEIDAPTWRALRANVPKIASVSAERVRDELWKLFKPPHAGRGLDLLRESGLLELLLPEIAEAEGVEQSPDYHPEGTVFEHLRWILAKLPTECDPLLPWAALLHDVGKPRTFSRDPDRGEIHFYGHEKVGAEMSETILRRLRFSKREIETVRDCVWHHMQFKDVQNMRRATLRRMLARPTFPLELELHRLDCLASHGRLDNYHFLRDFEKRLEKEPKVPPRLVTGNDLLARGMTPGPKLGRLLQAIRDKQLQGELVDRRAALDWVESELKRESEAELSDDE